MVTRMEHLMWCRRRALMALTWGGIHDAWKSMVTDTAKHEETRMHPSLELGEQRLIGGMLATTAAMEQFIKDFA
jgi:hypothetical protein